MSSIINRTNHTQKVKSHQQNKEYDNDTKPNNLYIYIYIHTVIVYSIPLAYGFIYLGKLIINKQLLNNKIICEIDKIIQ